MNVDIEELSKVKRRMKVEIPVDAINAALDEAYRELNKTAKVDGFRKGKTPRHILEKRYCEGVEAEVIQKLVPDYYIKAVEHTKLHPVANPAIEESALKLKKGQPLTFSASVEVRPDFELAQYKGLEVTDEKVEVTDEDMEEAIKEVRTMHSTLETVDEDRPAVKDDFVVIDFEGFIDGVAFDGGKANNYPLQLGSGKFIEGFEDQLIGAKKGDEKDVTVKFPSDYKNDKLAGKDAVFKVKVGELKKQVLPELDDELAKDLGMGDTVDALKSRIKEDILEAKKRELESRQKAQIIKTLAENNKFDLPPSMVEEEYRAMLVHHYQEMMRSGLTPQQAGFDMKEFEARFKPIAEDRVRTSLVVSAIAEKEKIEATDEDLQKFIRNLSIHSGKSVREIMELYQKREGGISELREGVIEEKVFDLLIAEAKK